MTTAAVRTPLELDVWEVALDAIDQDGADADSIIRAVKRVYGQPGLDALLATLNRMLELTNERSRHVAA